VEGPGHVGVTDLRAGDYFEIPAEPARALDDPFAYRYVRAVADVSRRRFVRLL
jgi:hypothetical protein